MIFTAEIILLLCLWHCVVFDNENKVRRWRKEGFLFGFDFISWDFEIARKREHSRRHGQENTENSTVRLESLWGMNDPQDFSSFSIEWRALSRPKFTSACCGAHGNLLIKPIYVIYFTGLNISVKLPILKLFQFYLIFQISGIWRAYNFLKLSSRKLYVLGKHLK